MNRKRIIQLLARAIGITYDELSSIPLNANLIDLGLESMSFIQFIVDIEEEFGIEVSDSDLLLSNFGTMKKLLNTLEKYFRKELFVKKVIICDCDNVLWKGVLGEENVTIGEENLILQKKLVELYDKGVLLCLCSKNYLDNVLQMFENSNMLLKKEYILLFKINFSAKSDNIKAIADELNLSMESMVFLDDSDYEIELVNTILPEVLTIKVSYPDINFIEYLDKCFDMSLMGSEQTSQYRNQRDRTKEKKKFKTIKEYNNSLQTSYICQLSELEEAERIAELSKRTKQFNLSNVQYAEHEIQNYILADKYSIISLKAQDKFGDMGIIGAAVIEHNEKNIIRGFFLSCRAFDRGFENILLDKIKCLCGDKLVGIYRENGKNKRFCNFYSSNGVEIYE